MTVMNKDSEIANITIETAADESFNKTEHKGKVILSFVGEGEVRAEEQKELTQSNSK